MFRQVIALGKSDSLKVTWVALLMLNACIIIFLSLLFLGILPLTVVYVYNYNYV